MSDYDSVWVVTFYQPGEGPSRVYAAQRSRAGAMEFVAGFCAGEKWEAFEGYWVRGHDGAVLRADRVPLCQ